MESDNVVAFRIKTDLDKKFFPLNDRLTNVKINYTYFHTLRVFNSVKNHELSIYCQILALLHDVVEDTNYTIDDLKKMYEIDFNWLFDNTNNTKMFFESLNALTRHKGESYIDYIKRVKTNSNATIVKILDLEDNLFNCIKSKNTSLVKRYINALKFLSE